MSLVIANTEDAQDMSMAKDIAETLFSKYAGYLWAVNVRGGVAIIKCLNVSSLWGYTLKYRDICHDAGLRNSEVIRAGGEILERAGQSRGERIKGEIVSKVDGIAKYAPLGVR